MQQHLPLNCRIESKDEILLVGHKVTVEDVNDELDQDKRPITKAFQHYYQTGISFKIENKSNNLNTYCAYFNLKYKNQKCGFDILIGEQVVKIGQLPQELTSFSIPKQDYIVFRTEKGVVGEVAKKAWGQIHQTNFEILGYSKTQINFEVYGVDQQDVNNMQYDIYVGVEKLNYQQLEEIQLVGYKATFEDIHDENHPISQAFGHYYQNQLFLKIKNRQQNMVCYCACFDCKEKDGKLGMTILIGEAVTKIEDVAEGMSDFVVPAQKYLKFTTQRGEVKTVAEMAWSLINSINYQSLKLKRTCIDFELYPADQQDIFNIQYDIYVGVQTE